MLNFQSDRLERRYRVFFNFQQRRGDILAHAVTIFLSTYILIRIYSTKTKWNHRAIFSIMFIGEKVFPAYFLWMRQDLWIEHRTLIYSILHIVHMVSGDLFCSFWLADADLSQPLHFYTVGVVNGGTLLALLFWGIYDVTPSTWHLGLQVLHAAKCSYEAPKHMSVMQPYLYHLTPLKNWVNTSPIIFLLHPCGMSERTLLLCIWAILRVLVGLVLPCSYVYRCQLASRRLWRHAELKRGVERRSTDGDESGSETVTGMKLLPVWKLYLPHMVVALIAAIVSGHDAKLLPLMF